MNMLLRHYANMKEVQSGRMRAFTD